MCTNHAHALLSLKSRSERMIGGCASEFSMLTSAQRAKEKVGSFPYSESYMHLSGIRPSLFGAGKRGIYEGGLS